MTVISSFLPVRTRPFHAMFNSITSGIHFAVTLTLNLWQWFPHFSPWERDLFMLCLALHLWHPFRCYVNIKHMTVIFSFDRILSLVASQSVMSLRPLNRQIAKSHLSVRQGLLRAWWLLIGYVIVTSEPTDSQVSSFSSTRTTTLSLVASQSVMSLRPLKGQLYLALPINSPPEAQGEDGTLHEKRRRTHIGEERGG